MLKCNLHEDTHKSKLKRKYNGLYMIVGISNNSSYYLKDCFSHFLCHSVPALELVKFFENKTYQCDKKTNTIQGDNSESNLSVQMNLSDDDDYIPGNSDSPTHHQKCQRTQSF